MREVGGEETIGGEEMTPNRDGSPKNTDLYVFWNPLPIFTPIRKTLVQHLVSSRV